MIINAGIQKIVYEEGYADALAKQMLRESRLKVEKFNRTQKREGVK
jgi:deoxycytidylate deaminase